MLRIGSCLICCRTWNSCILFVIDLLNRGNDLVHYRVYFYYVFLVFISKSLNENNYMKDNVYDKSLTFLILFVPFP